MFKDEDVEVQYGSLVQLTTALEEGSLVQPMTVVCKKFNRAHTLLAPNSQLGLMKYYDNSFFVMEYERYSQDNHSTVCFSDLFRLRHVCSGQYLNVEEWVANGNMNVILSREMFKYDKQRDAEDRVNYLNETALIFTQIDQDAPRQSSTKPGSVFQIRPLRSFEKPMSVVKACSRFSIYCPKFDVHLCRQTLGDREVLVGMVEPPNNHFGWRLNDIKVSSHPPNHIHNYDLVYITNRNTNGKLLMKDGELKVEEANPLYPLKSEPKSFECLWRLTDLMKNKYEKVKDIFGDTSSSPSTNLQVVFFSNAILDPFLKDYQLEKQEEQDLSSVTLTNMITGEKFGGADCDTYMRFSSTDSVYEVNFNLNNADYIKLCKKEGTRLQWLTKRPLDPEDRRLRRTSFVDSVSESSTFRIYKVGRQTRNTVYQLLEAQQKLQEYLNFLKENENWKYTSSQLKRIHSRSYSEVKYVLRYLKNKLEEPELKLTYQTIMYDIGLVRLLLHFIKYLYEITMRPAAIRGLKPLESCIGRTFRQLHIIFKLSCTDNSYNKERVLKEGASDLLILSLSSRSRFMDVQLETLKEILESSQYAEENVTRPNEITRLVEVFSKLQPKTLEKEYLFVRIMRLLTRSGQHIIPQNQRTIIKQVFRSTDNHIRRIKFLIGDSDQIGSAKHITPKRILVSTGERADQIEKIKYLWQKESVFGEEGLLELSEFYREATKASRPVQPVPVAERLDEGFAIFERFIEQVAKVITREELEQRRQRLINLWKVIEEWIELLSDVCDGRFLQGKWIAETIISPQVLVAILDHTQISENGTMHSCFVRLANNILVETVWNPLNHFNRVWYDRAIGMKHYRIEPTKRHTDAETYQRFVYPALQQYIKRFLQKFLDRYTQQKELFLPKEYKGISEKYTMYSTGLKYMEFTTRVMKLLRNMVSHKSWEAINNDERNEVSQERLISQLVEMLSRVRTWDGSAFKVEILRIINCFLDQDAQFRLKKVIDLVKEQRNETFKEGTLNEEKVYDTKMWCISDSTIVKLDYRLVHLMLTVYKSNTQLYMLCFRTRQKIMEVERNSLMARRYATIFELTPQSVKTVELLNQARHVFRLVLVPGGLRKLQIKNQYILAMPIWDIEGPCVIKMMLDITEAMKTPASTKMDYLKIYQALGSNRRTMQPYCQTQRPSQCVQRLVMQMGVIEPVVSFLQSCDIQSSSSLYRKLIQAAYLMLAVYMWNNEECKAKWSSSYRTFIQHAEHSVGALIALRQYCRNSYWLQCDDQKVAHIVNVVGKYLVSQLYVKKRYTMACRLLDFFSCMIYYRNKFLDTNRMKILLRIVDNDYPRICNPEMLTDVQLLVRIIRRNSQRNSGHSMHLRKTTSFDPQIFQQFQDEESQSSDERQQAPTDQVRYSPKLTYVVVLFRLLADLVKNHPTNMAKCKKLHLPSKITLVIENAKDCWALKASARRLLNNLYYFNMEDRYFETILSKDIPNILSDLNEYIFQRMHDRSNRMTRQQFEFQVREMLPMSMFTHNIMKVLDSLEILFRPEDSKHRPSEQNNFIPNRSRFLQEIILSLQSEESVSKQLYLKESMKEVSEQEEEDHGKVDDQLQVPPSVILPNSSEISEQVPSEKSQRSSQSPDSSKVKEYGRMNISNLPDQDIPDEISPSPASLYPTFKKLEIKRSESQVYIPPQEDKGSKQNSGFEDPVNELNQSSISGKSGSNNMQFGHRVNSEPFARKRNPTVTSRDRDSEASSDRESRNAEFFRTGMAAINRKRKVFIRDDWKKHYNMLRIRNRKNWEFNVSIFILFVRIYERLKLMRDNLFPIKSETHKQLVTIMVSLETSLFEVDLEARRFTYKYDCRSSFLYLNLFQDLLQVDRRNRHPDIRLREWLTGHPLLADARTTNDNASVALNHKIRNPSILCKINLERQNWETVTVKVKEEEKQVYMLLQRILKSEHISYFFEDQQLYNITLQHSQLIMSIYEPSNTIQQMRAIGMHKSSMPLIPQPQEDSYHESFNEYYRRKIFEDYESCRQFKQAKLYLPRLLAHQSETNSQEQQEAQLYKFNYIARMDMLSHSVNQLLESDPEALDEDLLQFHYRVLTKKLRRDSSKDPSRSTEAELSSTYREHLLNNLSGSVSSKLFHTVVKFNLESNFKLTHELFFFTANYFGSCQLTDAPQPLFDLVKQNDPRNLFISKIDSLVEFFVGDIVRNYELEHLQDSSSVGIDYVFRPELHCIDRPQDENGKNLEQSINRRYTFECCKNIYASLQLLCQNNFVAFKRELCEQTFPDKRLKINNRNLLIRSTIQLRKVFAVFSDRINDLPFKIINFLNEIAQIPCYENQLELAESTFFEDVCNFILNREHVPSPGTTIKESTLKEIIIIIEEFLKIVVSLLESNKEDIYIFFCNRFDHRFVKEVPGIYRKLLKKIMIDEHAVIEQKIRKMKAVFVIVYKLLNNYPEQASYLLEHMKRTFDDDAKIQKKETTGRYGHVMQDSYRKISTARRSVGRVLSLRVDRLWHKAASYLYELLNILVIPWQDRVTVIEPNVLLPPDDFGSDSDDDTKQTTQKNEPAPTEPHLIRRMLKPDRYHYMLNTILSIEVSIDNNLHTLYFFRPEEALLIKEDEDPQLERLLYKLDRTTQNSKLSSLLDQLPHLELYMKYKEFCRRTNYSFGEWSLFFYQISNWTSLAINILLVLTTQIHFQNHYLESANAQYLFIAQFVQLTFGTLYSYSTIRNKFKREEMRKYIRKEEENMKMAANEEKVHRLKAKFERTEARLDNNFVDLNFDEVHKALFSCASIFLYFLICVLGMFSSPYYYSAHIFYLFTKVKVLDNVYQAVFKNLQELLLLALVSVGIFLVLSVLVVNLYAPFANQPCNNMVECFVIVYSRQAYLEKQDVNDPSVRVLAFEVIYSILFGSLLGNVISGLFTDKFAQLRNLHDRVEQDESNQCYICGQSRHDIEKQPSPLTNKTSEKFEKHKQIRHNKWNYLYYIYQLKQKKSTEYTGIEYFIDAKWRGKSNSWFPVCEQNIHNVRQTIQEVQEQF